MSEQETETVDAVKDTTESEATKEMKSDEAPAEAADAKADGGDKPKADAKADDANDAEDQPAKEGDAEDSVPEVELKYPESLGEIAPEMDAEVKALIADEKLTQAQTDKMLGLYEKVRAAESERVMASHNEAKDEGLRALKEEHGKAFKEKAGQVKAFLKEKGGDDLVKFMDDTGGSTVPLLFNFLSQIAADYASDGGIKSPAKEAGKPQTLSGLLYDHPTSVKLASGQN